MWMLRPPDRTYRHGRPSVLTGAGVTDQPDMAWPGRNRPRCATTLSQPEQARVLRAGDLAMRGLIDAEEA